MFTAELIQNVAHEPGVYLMLSPKSAVLYVGKAKDLAKRLTSYLRQAASQYNKTQIMLNQVSRVDTIITRTEKEALILEASLIKKHSPKYNVILRDDKNYPLIKVTVQEEWPRVMMVRRRNNDGARYFGPYSSSSAMWATLKLISRLFPLRRCKGPKLKTRERPCLNHQMGQCLAPCAGDCDSKLYMENVSKTIMVLEGRNRDLIAELNKKMNFYAEQLLFEKAAEMRDQIASIEKTLEKQVIAGQNDLDQDIFGFCRQDAAVSVAVLILRQGVISGSRSYFLPDPFGDDQAIFAQVINQFYIHGDGLPREIILPFSLEDQDLLEERFSEMRGSRVHLTTPRRGKKHELMQMASKNAAHTLEEREKKKKSWSSLAASMVQKLRLHREPQTIECLDISNISGKLAVGSLVHFASGEPDKKKFRHYSIKTVEGPDDYAMMAESLERRLQRGIDEDTLPDVMLLDGGKGQLNVALRIAEKLGIRDEVDWLGIAKERDAEGEKLFKPGRKNAIILAAHDPVLLYLMRIRDESHRFGITFHRKKRNKSTLTSILDEIPGVGPERKKQLLKTLGSLKRVKNASIEDLETVPGVGRELAAQIHAHLHNSA